MTQRRHVRAAEEPEAPRGYVAVGDYTIDATALPLFVRSSDGMFWARFEGEEVTAPTLKSLKDKLRDLVRRILLVAVPACYLVSDTWDEQDGLEIQRVTLTGIHSSNRNVLYRTATGQTEQLRWSGHLYQDLSSAEVAEAETLCKAAYESEQAWLAWREKYQINGFDAIKAAQDAKRQK